MLPQKQLISRQDLPISDSNLLSSIDDMTIKQDLSENITVQMASPSYSKITSSTDHQQQTLASDPMINSTTIDNATADNSTKQDTTGEADGRSRSRSQDLEKERMDRYDRYDKYDRYDSRERERTNRDRDRETSVDRYPRYDRNRDRRDTYYDRGRDRYRHGRYDRERSRDKYGERRGDRHRDNRYGNRRRYDGIRKSDRFYRGERCFHCGEMGHWARDCPDADGRGRCFHCGEPGHMARNCPLKQKGKPGYRGRGYGNYSSSSMHQERSRRRSRSFSR